MRWLGLLMLMAMGVGVGCAPRASEGGLESDNPAAQLYAIRRAGASGDAAAAPKLVEHLESDDPAVRMFAILALEQLTGERMGYNPYAPAPERREAVERWRQAVTPGRGEMPLERQKATKRTNQASQARQ